MVQKTSREYSVDSKTMGTLLVSWHCQRAAIRSSFCNRQDSGGLLTGQEAQTGTHRLGTPQYYHGNHPVRTEERSLTNDKPKQNGQVKLRPVLDLRRRCFMPA